jgi:hypothetical protein
MKRSPSWPLVYAVIAAVILLVDIAAVELGKHRRRPNPTTTPVRPPTDPNQQARPRDAPPTAQS